MNDVFVRVAELSQLPSGTGCVLRVQGRSIALFHINGSVYAVDNACPHRDGPLGEGTLDGLLVSCPRHGWQIDVSTGVCVARPGRRVTTFPTRVEEGAVMVGVPVTPGGSASPPAGHFLVRFGAMGHVGRFQASEPVDAARGSRVVVQSSRGLEVGEVLWSGSPDSELIESQPDSGTLLRVMTEQDTVREQMFRDGVRRAFDACQQLLLQYRLPVDLIDAEELLDGGSIIFYFLGDPPPALADVTAELARRFEAQVQFRPFGDGTGDACGSCGSHGSGGCGQCSEEGNCGRHHGGDNQEPAGDTQ